MPSLQVIVKITPPATIVMLIPSTSYHHLCVRIIAVLPQFEHLHHTVSAPSYCDPPDETPEGGPSHTKAVASLIPEIFVAEAVHYVLDLVMVEVPFAQVANDGTESDADILDNLTLLGSVGLATTTDPLRRRRSRGRGRGCFDAACARHRHDGIGEVAVETVEIVGVVDVVAKVHRAKHHVVTRHGTEGHVAVLRLHAIGASAKAQAKATLVESGGRNEIIVDQGDIAKAEVREIAAVATVTGCKGVWHGVSTSSVVVGVKGGQRVDGTLDRRDVEVVDDILEAEIVEVIAGRRDRLWWRTAHVNGLLLRRTVQAANLRVTAEFGQAARHGHSLASLATVTVGA